MHLVYIEQAETSAAKAAATLDGAPSIAAPRNRKIELAFVAIAAQIALGVACALALSQSDAPNSGGSVPAAFALHRMS